ncbi:flavodoxin domain-containing protein [Bacillus sonorensis]|nr:flavodoxin domain-containing protein [Bacillus sonorensis]
MAKALITFASMSGNTEDIAMIIKDTFTEHSIDVEYMEMDDVDVDTLSEYDYILIGTYTWGDGDLPYEAEAFYEDVSSLVLKGKKLHALVPEITRIQNSARRLTRFTACLNRRGRIFFRNTQSGACT